ncbi:Hypothetical protein KVN_LOCUS360 [uncultured virus]|nr:Hypothetical protein KVN_LOCUS360 [uncultured virus]
MPSLIQPNPKPDQKPIVDLQVYEPYRPVPKPLPIDPSIYLGNYPTTGPFFPPQYSQCSSLPTYQRPPIINTYSINVNGPMTDHAKLSAIYEDILPSKQFSNTSNTLGERLNIYQFVRSVFIKQGDGEDINLDGSKTNSLLSYLKFMELNPYSQNLFTDNPYKSLPDDMLIYRSCYPIRYDKYSANVNCATNSVGLNIRIYRLTLAEYYIKNQKNNEYNNYNIWREIAYYEYIREQIIKRNVSPNFVLLYGYYICENCNIDFNKLAELKGKYRKNELFYTSNDTKNTQQNSIINTQEIYNKPVLIPSINQMTITNPINTIDMNYNAFSGRALIGLTEAPNYNIYSWASRTYKVEGNIRRMVNTGFYNSDIWLSVIFQIFVALYVLQIHKIAFKNFTIEDNIYIKDLAQHSNVTNYWKYVIDGIDYYIPNYGYLVMFDSNFKDVENDHFTLGQNTKNNKYKIYSSIFEKNGTQNDNYFLNLSFSSFKKAIDPNVFSKSFTSYGGNKPPESVLDLLNKINSETNINNPNKDIGYYLYSFMRKFMHNRIGTILKESEIKNIRKDDAKPFRKGQILVYEFQHDTYQYILYLSNNNNNMALILTKEDSNLYDIIEKNVSIGSLYNYSPYEQIIQLYKPNEANLNEEDLLEIYVINKN